MTQPEPQSIADAVSLNFGAQPAPGPDGQPWVLVTFALGLAQFQLLLPEPLVTNAIEPLGKQLAEAAANARRMKLGLILPSNGGSPMPPLPPLPPLGPPGVPRG